MPSKVFMLYDRDPDQDLSNRHQPPKQGRWDFSTLIIGLIVILTGGYLIVAGSPSVPRAGFQRIEATPVWPPPPQ